MRFVLKYFENIRITNEYVLKVEAFVKLSELGSIVKQLLNI